MIKRTYSGPSGPFFSPSARPLFQTGLVAALIGFGIYFDHADSLVPPAGNAIAALHADLARERASPAVGQFAQWVIGSRDHADLPFVVVDKAQARLFTFDPQGRLSGSAPVLLGSARGDDPAVPATPAGRYITDTWLSARADGIIWVNAGTAVSLHAMPSERAPGRGPQRLASERVDDRRISDGSLHVAGEFYRRHLGALRTQVSVAYVLPEVLSVQQVFQGHPPQDRTGTRYAQSPRGYVARRPS